MKLHLLIDSNIKASCDADDFAIVSSFRDGPKLNCRQSYLDLLIVNEKPVIGEAVRQLLSNFDTSYLNIANEVYVRFLLPIYTVIANVEKLLSEQDVDEIVLYEGCDYPFFMAEGAEGEGIRNHYKTNWLVNVFVYHFFKGRINISWLKKDSIVLMRWRNYFRNKKHIVRLLLSRCLRGIIERRFTSQIVPSEKQIVSIITLELQKRDLDAKLSDIKNNQHLYYSYNRELVDNKDVLPIQELSISEFFHTIVYVKRLHRPKELMLLGVRIHALNRELQYLMQKHFIYEKRLEKTLLSSMHPKGTIMLTNTTVGMDMIAIRNVSRRLGWRHINMQYVSMGRVLYPDLDLADEYYLYARKTYDLYKDYNSIFHLYFPIKNKTRQVVKGSSIKYTIFTQPDRYAYDYIEYLKEVLPALSLLNSGIEVIIKPHYRQSDLKPFISFCDRFPFVRLASSNENVEHILNETTIAMSMHSSVIFEAMMNHVPTIVYNPEDKYHEDVYNNDICYPEVNFVIEEPMQTMGILDNINNIVEQFERNITLFVQNNQVRTNIQSIIEV